MNRLIVPALSIVALLIAARTLPADDAAKTPAVDTQRLAEIPARMQKFVDDHQISGAVTLVAYRGKVVGLDAVGLANIRENRPMQDDTLFWIASMTKPITATALMILQDEGKLSVSDPVSKFIPEFKEVTVNGHAPARPMTIQDLLTHTSGVANPPNDNEHPNPTLAETAVLIAGQPLQFEPGSQWRYGSGPTVVGRVIEVASGKSYESFLEERIFQPLGMKDTGFYPDAKQRGRLATIYQPGLEPGSLEPTSAAFINADENAPRRAPNPSGGLFSTAGDLYRFYQMVLNGGELDGTRILSSEAVKQMTTAKTGDLQAGFVPGSAWALGWGTVSEPTGVTRKLSPGTFGHGGAFGTQGWVDPQRQLIVVLLIQRSNLGNSDASDIRGAFQELAVSACGN